MTQLPCRVICLLVQAVCMTVWCIFNITFDKISKISIHFSSALWYGLWRGYCYSQINHSCMFQVAAVGAGVGKLNIDSSAADFPVLLILWHQWWFMDTICCIVFSNFEWMPCSQLFSEGAEIVSFLTVSIFFIWSLLKAPHVHSKWGY